MQFLAQIPDPLDELAFHPGVDVLGIRLQDLLRIGLHFGQQAVQGHFQTGLFIGAQNADLYQRPGPTD